jgi:hypothetical protein
MSKLESASPNPFLLLLAKGVLAMALFAPIVYWMLYPARKAESNAYEQAPVCAAGIIDSASCRLMTDAELVKVNCPKRKNNADDFCEVELQVSGLKRFIGFDRSLVEPLAPGTHLRVEMFRTLPTKAELGGQLVVGRGSPQEAMHSLTKALWITTGLGLIAAIYLAMVRRKK